MTPPTPPSSHDPLADSGVIELDALTRAARAHLSPPSAREQDHEWLMAPAQLVPLSPPPPAPAPTRRDGPWVGLAAVATVFAVAATAYAATTARRLDRLASGTTPSPAAVTPVEARWSPRSTPRGSMRWRFMRCRRR